MTLSGEILFALGPLAALVQPRTRDIVVNPDGSVWADHGAGLTLSPAGLIRPDVVRHIASMLLSRAGRSVDDAHLIGDASVSGAVRVNALLPPLVGPGPALSLRFHPTSTVGWSGFVDERGDPVEARLRDVVGTGTSVLITGATGAGKTTLASLMLGAVADTRRIIVIEDTAELAPHHPHVVALQTVHANAEGAGAVGLGELVRAGLRMRPDWLVVGEVRGAEIVDLLVALTTGHAGLGTLHATSFADLPARLHALAALAGLDAQSVGLMAASAFPVVVHCERWGSRTRVSCGRLRFDANGVRVVAP